ncbi:MAG: KH domain-containing protein [Chloroflexi bacterium]|nr:KH domain-containing protein [Chloroflexota bacterium]MBI3734015.1 KH domain-containing protein [Chloroflexota bacterium]
MRELIEYMAKELSSRPDQVRVKEAGGLRHTVIYLNVAQDDIGRIIGKSGRIANAMRILLRVAAIRQGKRVTLEIR